MNKPIRKLIRALVRNNLAWKFFDQGYRFFNRFRLERNLLEQPNISVEDLKMRNLLMLKFSDLTVRNGPFRGLLYPAFISHNSALFPKLLGSYESELWPTFEKLLDIKFTRILDIGCAEGYYAVGLARLQPQAEVIAYDLDASALDECERMARLNKTSNVRFVHRCLPTDLLSLEVKGETLVVSDCEGYELELFSEDVVRHLYSAHFVIELHDYRNELILPHIERVFESSHYLTLIPSINTIKKIKALNLDSGLSDELIARFFAERNSRSEWAVLKPK